MNDFPTIRDLVYGNGDSLVRLAARPRARHTRRQRHLFRPKSVFLREHSLERHCEGEHVNVNSAAIAFYGRRAESAKTETRV
jgi:hypothetical protein